MGNGGTAPLILNLDNRFTPSIRAPVRRLVGP